MKDILAQYAEAKAKYPKHLLFFRVGDFYELFNEEGFSVAVIDPAEQKHDVTLTPAEILEALRQEAKGLSR